MKKQTVKFLLARLKGSSPHEILYRFREQIFIRALKRFPSLFRESLRVPPFSEKALETMRFPALRGKVDEALTSRILQGERFCLNCDPADIARFEDHWRSSFFSDVSAGPRDPDIRAVWENGRLQHLMLVLHALRCAPHGPAADNLRRFAEAELSAWLERNPFPLGPHYMSAMECGLRIPVFSLGLKLLDNLSHSERMAVHEAVYAHAWLIGRRLSLYCSLGNHTIAEAVGLVFAGGLFRECAQGRQWMETGIGLLGKESFHQILDDGGPAEQSFNYHRFVLDLYWLAVGFLEENHFHDCSIIVDRLKAGEKFLEAFTAGPEQLPSIGDSDDGSAVAPGLSPLRAVPGDSVAMRREPCPMITFPRSGYTMIDMPPDGRIIFDHGALGMPPLFNHGHADALSIVLFRAGKPFLADPGTYGYNGDERLRAYFRGTRAHNTVTVDHEDQAVQVTRFIWDRPYRADGFRREVVREGTIISAAHNGYSRLAAPIRHKRSLLLADGGGCVVRDTFQGLGMHHLEINYHLHPDVRVAGHREDDWYVLDNGGISVFLRVLELDLQAVRGQEAPLLGWFSPRYGILEETTVLHGRTNGLPEKTRFTTLISLTPPENEKLEELAALL